MKETLIETLMYIFSQILDDDSYGAKKDHFLARKFDDMAHELSAAADVTDEQVALIHDFYRCFSTIDTPRHLSYAEMRKLGHAGWGYLLSLEQAGITPSWIRELILHEVDALEKGAISLRELKVIVFQVMQKIIKKEDDMVWLDQLMFHSQQITVQ